VEVTTTFSSTSMPGRPEGSDPLAMTMFLASCTSSPTLTLPGSGMLAPALQPVDLVLLEQELDALGVLADDVVLVGQHLFPVDPGLLPFRPILAKLCSASCSWWEACSSALDGMQPTFRQVPPSVSRPSTQAVLRPSCAQRMAQT
jgi:hypothetical protein